MNSQSTADRISQLPDEILHCIISRLRSFKTAAKTVGLSRRWRDLWRSYPVVKFDNKDKKKKPGSQSFEKFCDATMARFSRDSLLRMESLKLTLRVGHSRVPELLDLASKREAAEVEILVGDHRFTLPITSLSIPAAKILKLRWVVFDFDSNDSTLNLNSLRFLHLHTVSFCDADRELSNLIASSPLLEALEVTHIFELTKLKVSTPTPNLKTLKFGGGYYLNEIEIAAPQLRTLQIQKKYSLAKLGLTAPQLTLLEISGGPREAGILEEVISNLSSLKSLTLTHLPRDGGKKLKLRCPKLEEFTIYVHKLEEIELHAGPRLSKFLLHFKRHDSLDVLKRCEISPNCRWEVDIINHDVNHHWFVSLKNLLARYTQFSMVNIVPYFIGKLNEENVDHTLLPINIEHLKITKDHEAFLDGLFWAIHPEFLTITNFDCSSSFLMNFLKLATSQTCEELFSRKESDEHRGWRHQLKDVRIVHQSVDRAFTEEVKEEELISLSETAIASLTGRKQVCFKLTWHSS